jgi:hypothetical protein
MGKMACKQDVAVHTLQALTPDGRIIKRKKTVLGYRYRSAP